MPAKHPPATPKSPAPQAGDFPIHEVMTALKATVAAFQEPIVTQYSKQGGAPFRVLISTLISLRTKDAVTHAASERLFALAQSPRELLALDEETIAKAIYPAGFYKTKAKTLRAVAERLINQHAEHVPADLDTLLALPGVGRKTANLVLTLGYGKPGICVDTHVHRICNRLGYVTSKTPEETEMALRAKLPHEYWIPINDYLVSFGQNLCLPTSPLCSRCPINPLCQKSNIPHSR